MKNIKTILAVICLFLGLSSQIWAKDAAKMYIAANENYIKNNLDQAIKQYEELIREGYTNAEIFYNLGNAYYKKGEVAASVLNYERAKKMRPEDEDILFNLKMANLKVTDKMDPVPPVFYEQWWKEMVHLFSADRWAATAVVLVWLILAAVALFFLSREPLFKRVSFYSALVMTVLAIFSFVFAHAHFVDDSNSHEAIVFSPSVYVKSSPAEKSTDLFILHEGTKVQLLDEVEEWKKIRLANGHVGWLKETTVQAI